MGQKHHHLVIMFPPCKHRSIWIKFWNIQQHQLEAQNEGLIVWGMLRLTQSVRFPKERWRKHFLHALESLPLLSVTPPGKCLGNRRGSDSGKQSFISLTVFFICSTPTKHTWLARPCISCQVQKGIFTCRYLISVLKIRGEPKWTAGCWDEMLKSASVDQ